MIYLLNLSFSSIFLSHFFINIILAFLQIDIWAVISSLQNKGCFIQYYWASFTRLRRVYIRGSLLSSNHLNLTRPPITPVCREYFLNRICDFRVNLATFILCLISFLQTILANHAFSWSFKLTIRRVDGERRIIRKIPLCLSLKLFKSDLKICKIQKFTLEFLDPYVIIPDWSDKEFGWCLLVFFKVVFPKFLVKKIGILGTQPSKKKINLF